MALHHPFLLREGWGMSSWHPMTIDHPLLRRGGCFHQQMSRRITSASFLSLQRGRKEDWKGRGRYLHTLAGNVVFSDVVRSWF
jgi:hypothetical protein